MAVTVRKFSQKRKLRTKKDEFLWLISLSDMMMLLFIFFVVLFAFTYQKVKNSELMRILSVITEGEQGQTDIEKIKTSLTEWIAKENLVDQIIIKKNGDMLEVQIKDKVLFDSGEYKLHTKGVEYLKAISKVLDKVPDPYQLGIEGHTDDTPIHTSKIKDNWDLSAKRALSVLWAMDLSYPTLKRTVIQAYGEMRPIAANRDKDGEPIIKNQRLNRRVTIRIF